MTKQIYAITYHTSNKFLFILFIFRLFETCSRFDKFESLLRLYKEEPSLLYKFLWKLSKITRPLNLLLFRRTTSTPMNFIKKL